MHAPAPWPCCCGTKWEGWGGVEKEKERVKRKELGEDRTRKSYLEKLSNQCTDTTTKCRQRGHTCQRRVGGTWSRTGMPAIVLIKCNDSDAGNPALQVSVKSGQYVVIQVSLNTVHVAQPMAKKPHATQCAESSQKAMIVSTCE